MRILFLNRSFWPDTDATGVLLAELAEDLAATHEVTVICGPANTRPHRSRMPFRRESFGAVKIVRTFGASLSKKNIPGRCLNLTVYFILAALAALRERPDVIVAETDPPLLGLLGAIVARIRRCRFVYYCQDLFPDIAQATGGLKSRPLLWGLGQANNFAYRRANAIVVLANDMADRLRRKGVPADRIVVAPNWIDCGKVRPENLQMTFREFGHFVVMYAGNLGLSQSLETVLEAAHQMRDDSRVKFVLVGDGARRIRLQEEAQSRRLTNVEFVAHQAPVAMSEVLATANLHLIPLVAGAAGCLVPSKVYGILAAGRPFVAMMEDDAEVARLAADFKVGFVTPPGDPARLTGAITEALEDPARLNEMGRRARLLAENRFNRRDVTRRFAQLLEAVVSDATPRPAAPARSVKGE
ncbi:MAG TPA: glycosyltransferase family 4 protein [Candidatus Binataceae bacterium]|nr:glycosyltransferase family 4 protein [Candidatus Binataceae bacterium]